MHMRFINYLLSQSIKTKRLSILIYHRIQEHQDAIETGNPDVAAFRWQIELLARYFNLLPLTEAVHRLREFRLPERAACITFDDGYVDNFELALPILKEVGAPAAFFIATGFLNGGRMWNDSIIESIYRMPDGTLDLSERGLGVYVFNNIKSRTSAISKLVNLLKYQPFAEREANAEYIANLVDSPLPQNLMMSSDQVRAMHAAGMEIGAHTVSHPILASLDIPQARREIADSKNYLEKLLGEPITLFAYPNGKPGQDYLSEHVDIVKEMGFEAAVSTSWGGANIETDIWQLPRFTPWDITPTRFMARLLWNSRRKPLMVPV